MKRNKRYILVSEKGWHGIRQLSLDLADKGLSSTVLIRGMADKAARDMITKRMEINNVFIPGKIFMPFLFMYVLSGLISCRRNKVAVFLSKDKTFERFKSFKRIFSRLEPTMVSEKV